MCDIIIPIWNQLEFSKSCIEHIAENTHYPHRLILVDNGSGPETKSYLETLRREEKVEIVLLRNNENLGFVKAVNQGLEISDTPYVCVLNNDTMPGAGWLSELVKFAEGHPDVGLLNPLSSGHKERGLTINEYAREVFLSNKGKYMEMNQCQGFSMLIKRELIDKIGHLDEKFGLGGFDDTDYSMRAHIAGYKCVCVYSSYVYHREHASFDSLGDRKKLQLESEKEYFKKWPRHKRVAMIFFVSKDTSDKEIRNCLGSALSLARSWCWVSLWIFGDGSLEERVATIMERISFPLHQNIKFNYLSEKFKILQIAARILERSFGSKRRKKYDGVIYDEKRFFPFLKVLCDLQGCRVMPLDFAEAGLDARDASLRDVLFAERPWCPAEGGTSEAKSRVHFSSEGKNARSRKEASRASSLSYKCDIILPVCGQYEVTKNCIDSIARNTDTPFRLIIINNGSDPETKKFLDELGGNKEVETAIVHNGRNIGWVKALNQGLELSRAPFVCFQNNDTIATRGWLRKMINTLNLEENFGLINPTWEKKPEGVSHDGYNAMLEKNEKKFIETDWCRGFCVVAKKRVIEKVGRVDESFELGYFDDVDYSVRAQEAGFFCLKALDTYVYHERNVTASRILKGKKWEEVHEKNKYLYYKKWGRPLRINIILDDKNIAKNFDMLREIRDAVFYLARKQHHVNVWSPVRLGEEFQHTNVKLKICHPFLLNFLTFFDLYINKKKKPVKRYNAIFKYAGNKDFTRSMKETVDGIKEKTKETPHVFL